MVFPNPNPSLQCSPCPSRQWVLRVCHERVTSCSLSYLTCPVVSSCVHLLLYIFDLKFLALTLSYFFQSSSVCQCVLIPGVCECTCSFSLYCHAYSGGKVQNQLSCRRQSISICSLHPNPFKPGHSEKGLTNLHTSLGKLTTGLPLHDWSMFSFDL